MLAEAWIPDLSAIFPEGAQQAAARRGEGDKAEEEEENEEFAFGLGDPAPAK